MKTLFACDLDNTLLIPRKKRKPEDIPAELYNGEEISFFTPASLGMLSGIAGSEEIFFLPVTSRSIEQYKRIELPESISCALVCNGAILLENGVRDKNWDEYMHPFISRAQAETRELYERYKDDGCFSTVRIVDDIFLFAACHDAEEARQAYSRLKPETSLGLFLSGRKLYWFFEGCDKGSAVRRFARENGYERIIAAGDSDIDISMLDSADVAAVPDRSLAGKLSCRNVKICGDERFPEFILKTALNMSR